MSPAHRSPDEEQHGYPFTTVEKLLHDFKDECGQLRWRWE
jgi:hypothetical protein